MLETRGIRPEELPPAEDSKIYTIICGYIRFA